MADPKEPVSYKVVDHPWSPLEPDNTQVALTEIGQDGWRLIFIYPDRQREKTRWIFTR
jgi:hypothetical protein